MLINAALATNLLSSNDIASLISGGFLYLFDGPVPSGPDVAVDGSCQTLAKISLNATATGLSFTDVAAAGQLAKPSAAIWSGSGLVASVPTFCRWCMSADNGRSAVAAGAYRMQGTAGAIGDTPTPELGLTDLPTVVGKTIQINSFVIAAPGFA